MSWRRHSRGRNYIPIVFDFERARKRDLVESTILLAGLSRLVIVDITDPRSTPMELHAIVPNFAVSGRADYEERHQAVRGLLRSPQVSLGAPAAHRV